MSIIVSIDLQRNIEHCVLGNTPAGHFFTAFQNTKLKALDKLDRLTYLSLRNLQACVFFVQSHGGYPWTRCQCNALTHARLCHLHATLLSNTTAKQTERTFSSKGARITDGNLRAGARPPSTMPIEVTSIRPSIPASRQVWRGSLEMSACNAMLRW